MEVSLVCSKEGRGENCIKMTATSNALMHCPGCSKLTAVPLKQAILLGVSLLRKKETILCTLLVCLGKDLHIKFYLGGQKQHKVVTFFNDKNIQAQPPQHTVFPHKFFHIYNLLDHAGGRMSHVKASHAKLLNQGRIGEEF